MKKQNIIIAVCLMASIISFASCKNRKQEGVIMHKAKATEIVEKVAKRFMLKKKVWGKYTIDLTHEAMLEYGMATGKGEFDDYVFDIFKQRKWTPDTIIKWKGQPFAHINYVLYKKTKDKRYIKPFVDESMKYLNEINRSDDGLILHECPAASARANVLIDSFQDYIARIAETGKLTNDKKLYKECVEQYRLHRKILRNPQNNLWSNGRGWHEDINKKSDGFWSRGHGWLINGLVKAICVLPKDSEYYKEMRGYLVELVDALIKVQDKDGMWHKMLHFEFKDSPVEMSGTALICSNVLKAVNHGILTDEKYKKAAMLAFKGMQKHITEEGVIKNVDHRGGPLKSMEGYLNNEPGGDDDGEGHALMAVIFTCSETLKLKAEK